MDKPVTYFCRTCGVTEERLFYPAKGRSTCKACVLRKAKEKAARPKELTIKDLKVDDFMTMAIETSGDVFVTKEVVRSALTERDDRIARLEARLAASDEMVAALRGELERLKVEQAKMAGRLDQTIDFVNYRLPD